MDDSTMFLAHGLLATFTLGALGLLLWAFIEPRRTHRARRTRRRPGAR